MTSAKERKCRKTRPKTEKAVHQLSTNTKQREKKGGKRNVGKKVLEGGGWGEKKQNGSDEAQASGGTVNE